MVVLVLLVVSLVTTTVLIGVLLYRSRVRPAPADELTPADQLMIREMVGQLKEAQSRRTICAERMKTIVALLVNHAALNQGAWPDDYTGTVKGPATVCPECMVATEGNVEQSTYLFLKPTDPPAELDGARPLLMDPLPVHPGARYQVALKDGTVDEVPETEIGQYLGRWSITVPGITDRDQPDQAPATP